MIKQLRGILFVILLFGSALLGSVFLITPVLPLIVISPKHWRTCADRLVGYWITFSASLCELLFGTKFYVTGDLIDRDQPGIMIMNHRTRLDWLFFWNALYKMDPWLLTTEKILLKAPLKYLPGAGWAMECGAYIFLKRKVETDLDLIDNMVSYYKESGNSYQLLLFPEGTDRCEHSAMVSDNYAKKNNLPKYQYVLHPRTTGFSFLLQNMLKKDYLKYVYDVTVGYPKELVTGETEIIKHGLFPKEVHFDIRRYDISEIAKESEDDIANWLCKVWAHKEDRLARFYQKENKFVPSGEQFVWPVETTGIGYYCAFIFWVVSFVAWVFLIYSSLAMKVFFGLSCLFFISCEIYLHGVTTLFIETHNVSKISPVEVSQCNK
uniref:PlsC domain-containing protein n=1 Tax=Syphacia muris TaxID=451379 RepID=A0A0N5AZV1_9BILA